MLCASCYDPGGICRLRRLEGSLYTDCRTHGSRCSDRRTIPQCTVWSLQTMQQLLTEIAPFLYLLLFCYPLLLTGVVQSCWRQSQTHRRSQLGQPWFAGFDTIYVSAYCSLHATERRAGSVQVLTQPRLRRERQSQYHQPLQR